MQFGFDTKEQEPSGNLDSENIVECDDVVENEPFSEDPAIVVLAKEPLQIHQTSHVLFELINPPRGVVVVFHSISDVVLLVERIIEHYKKTLSHRND